MLFDVVSTYLTGQIRHGFLYILIVEIESNQYILLQIYNIVGFIVRSLKVPYRKNSPKIVKIRENLSAFCWIL